MSDEVSVLLDGNLGTLEAFSIAAASEQLQSALCSRDGAQTLVQRLRELSDVSCIGQMSRILTEVFQKEPDLRQEAMPLLAQVASWLQSLSTDEGAQHVMGLVLELISTADGQAALRQAQPLQEGAGNALVSILSYNMHDVDVLDMGLEMVTVLCDSQLPNEGTAAPPQHLLLIGAGILDTLVEVLETHVEVPGLILQTLSILAKLGAEITDEYRSRLYTESVMEAIFRAMATNVENGELQTLACWLLEKFWLDNESNGALMASQHGVDAIRKVLQHHTSNAQVVHKALELISNICEDDSCLETVHEELPFKLILFIWAAFRHNVKLQETIAFVLAKLAGVYGAELLAEGGLEAVVDCMAVHSAAPEVLEYAWIAVEKLAQFPDAIFSPKMVADLQPAVQSSLAVASRRMPCLKALIPATQTAAGASAFLQADLGTIVVDTLPLALDDGSALCAVLGNLTDCNHDPVLPISEASVHALVSLAMQDMAQALRVVGNVAHDTYLCQQILSSPLPEFLCKKLQPGAYHTTSPELHAWLGYVIAVLTAGGPGPPEFQNDAAYAAVATALHHDSLATQQKTICQQYMEWVATKQLDASEGQAASTYRSHQTHTTHETSPRSRETADSAYDDDDDFQQDSSRSSRHSYKSYKSSKSSRTFKSSTPPSSSTDRSTLPNKPHPLAPHLKMDDLNDEQQTARSFEPSARDDDAEPFGASSDRSNILNTAYSTAPHLEGEDLNDSNTPRTARHSLGDGDHELQKMIEELSGRVTLLQDHNAALQAEVLQLQGQVCQLQAELDQNQSSALTAAQQAEQQGKLQMELEELQRDVQSRLATLEEREQTVLRQEEELEVVRNELAEKQKQEETLQQDWDQRELALKNELETLAQQRCEFLELQTKVQNESAEVEKVRKAMEAKEAQLVALARKVEFQQADLEWREKGVVNKEKEGNMREQTIDRRDLETKKKEKVFLDKQKDQEAREKLQILKERELNTTLKDLERRETAVRERVKQCEQREETVEERSKEIAFQEQACASKEEHLTLLEFELTKQEQSLNNRESKVAELAEEVRLRSLVLDQREEAVTARETTYKEQKKQLLESKRLVQKREADVMEWIKELQWREYDFQKREEADRKLLNGWMAKPSKTTFGESLVSVQLGRLKDVYISSKEKMLRERVHQLPEVVKRKKEFMWEVKDYSAMKALNKEVKEKGIEFRRIMARLRGLQLGSSISAAGISSPFTPEEMDELNRISARENELSDEASFMLQILACPMNDRHIFTSEMDLVLALEEWWIDARDSLHDRHLGLLRERQTQLDHAMQLLTSKKDSLPTLFVKREMGPISPVVKRQGGLIFSASFPTGEKLLKPIPDKWNRPYAKVEPKRLPYGRLPKFPRSPKKPNRTYPGLKPRNSEEHSDDEIFKPQSPIVVDNVEAVPTPPTTKRSTGRRSTKRSVGSSGSKLTEVTVQLPENETEMEKTSVVSFHDEEDDRESGVADKTSGRLSYKVEDDGDAAMGTEDAGMTTEYATAYTEDAQDSNRIALPSQTGSLHGSANKEEEDNDGYDGETCETERKELQDEQARSETGHGSKKVDPDQQSVASSLASSDSYSDQDSFSDPEPEESDTESMSESSNESVSSRSS